jgi:urease accessory protein
LNPALFYFSNALSFSGKLFVIFIVSFSTNSVVRNSEMTSKMSGIKNWSSVGLHSVIKIAAAVSVLLSLAVPAYAHHPTGGGISTTFLGGFLSGLGHPVIGIDHLIFVISVGLLASTVARGFWIPVAFVSTALAGTSIHLMQVNVPMVEMIVGASVMISGILLARREKPNVTIIAILAGVAGLFHGYAYGEAIIGATAVPLSAYLLGFTLIQAMIALGAYKVAMMVKSSGNNRPNFLRFAGYIAIGTGMMFMAAGF